MKFYSNFIYFLGGVLLIAILYHQLIPGLIIYIFHLTGDPFIRVEVISKAVMIPLLFTYYKLAPIAFRGKLLHNNYSLIYFIIWIEIVYLTDVRFVFYQY